VKKDKTLVMKNSNNKILNIAGYQKTKPNQIENFPKRTNNLKISQYIMLQKKSNLSEYSIFIRVNEVFSPSTFSDYKF